MRFEGFNASCSPSFEPLTDRPLTDSQHNSNVLLLPALLFQFPRSFPSFFSPIGFLWCSHASYLSTLYLSLPRSVEDKNDHVPNRIVAIWNMIVLFQYYVSRRRL